MRQAETFRRSEGDAWLLRNETKLTVRDDPVLDAIGSLNLRPSSVLEIGCSNGWRLKALQNKYSCNITGVEPGKMKESFILRGTAERLPINKLKFDLVIFGWCLYLCDREDLFKIAGEADRVLREDGYLIVYDFFAVNPHRRKYKHVGGLHSYKYDYRLLWLGNPIYTQIYQSIMGKGDDMTTVSILQKSTEKGWPLRD